MRPLALALVTVAGIGAWGVVRQLSVSDTSAGPATAAKAQEIQSIALDGHGLPVVALRATLSTHVGDEVDTDKLERDRATLQAALEARGYLTALVRPAQITFGTAGGAFVTYSIAQGPVFHVRSVEVTGATAKDAGVVTIAPGDTMLADRVERAREALADRLATRGKARPVKVVLRTDASAAAVDVELAAAR